ncbi:hypothetical protein LXA43DRAFT_1065270 [Ganoderma leucocontextum]|nr:hypothetical protein LXA43DRAFT_1065270 [Ganoderma leucocontextum]
MPPSSNPAFEEELHQFVGTILSPVYVYEASNTSSIISDFLRRIQAVSAIANVDISDSYFNAIYHFLSEQPLNQRPAPEVLRQFSTDYLIASRQCAHTYARSLVQHARNQHYRAVAQLQKAQAAEMITRKRLRQLGGMHARAAADLAVINAMEQNGSRLLEAEPVLLDEPSDIPRYTATKGRVGRNRVHIVEQARDEDGGMADSSYAKPTLVKRGWGRPRGSGLAHARTATPGPSAKAADAPIIKRRGRPPDTKDDVLLVARESASVPAASRAMVARADSTASTPAEEPIESASATRTVMEQQHLNAGGSVFDVSPKSRGSPSNYLNMKTM